MSQVYYLVVDDSELWVRSAMRLLGPGLCVGAREPGEALQAARWLKPKVVLLDVDYGPTGAYGLDWIARFTKLGCSVLVVTGQPEVGEGAIATQAGAFAYLPKSDPLKVRDAAVQLAFSPPLPGSQSL